MDRRQAIQKEFAAQGIEEDNIHCVNAIHGNTINIANLQAQGMLENRTLTRGQIGCYLSHVKAWEQFDQDVTQNYAFVFEDDITFIVPDFLEQMVNIIQQLEENKVQFDVLYLSRNYFGETFHPGFWTGPKVTPNVYKPNHMGGGAHSYVLSKEGAKKLLILSKPIKIPLDMMMLHEKTEKLSVHTFMTKARNWDDSDTAHII